MNIYDFIKEKFKFRSYKFIILITLIYGNNFFNYIIAKNKKGGYTFYSFQTEEIKKYKTTIGIIRDFVSFFEIFLTGFNYVLMRIEVIHGVDVPDTSKFLIDLKNNGL